MNSMIFDTDQPITAKIPQMLAYMAENNIDEIDCIRYITPAIAEEKCIKIVEVAAIAATKGKIKLAPVYETFGADQTAGAGRAAGNFALNYMNQVLYAPLNSVSWYTQDRDTTASEMPGVEAAFEAYGDAMGDPKQYRVGSYGSGFCCDTLAAKGLIDYAVVPDPPAGMTAPRLIWLTDSTGFNGSKASAAAGRYVLLQKLPLGQFGLDTDPDLSPQPNPNLELDLGFFIPNYPVPTAVDSSSSAADIAYLQVSLVLKGAKISVDGIWGPETAAAVNQFGAIV